MRAVGVDSLVYVGSALANAGLPFLLLPILARALGPSEYGVLGNFTVLVQASAVLVGLSTHGYLAIRFFETSKRRYAEAVGGCLLLALATTVVGGALLQWLGGPVEATTGVGPRWLWTVPLAALGQFTLQVLLGSLRVRHRALGFGSFQVSATTVNLVGTLALVLWAGWGWEGRAATQAFGTLAVASIGLVLEWRAGYVRFARGSFKLGPAVRFGVFLLPHSLAMVVLAGADRLTITRLIGSGAAGEYFAAFQIAWALTLLASAVNQAWSPRLYKLLADGGEGERVEAVRGTYLMFALLAGAALILVATGRTILPFLAGTSFSVSAATMVMLVAASAFRGAYFMVTNYVFFRKQTGRLSIATVSAAGLHVGLLFLLVPRMGPEGAALATLCATATHFLVVAILAIRAVSMPWRRGWAALLSRRRLDGRG